MDCEKISKKVDDHKEELKRIVSKNLGLNSKGYFLTKALNSEGACSVVYACENYAPEQYSAKYQTFPNDFTSFVAKVAVTEEDVELLRHEIEMLFLLKDRVGSSDCPCVQPVFYRFDSEKLGVLILDRYKGSLSELIKRRSKERNFFFSEKKVCFSLAKALDEMHRCDIIHADLKPANILVQSNESVRLCDFGLSKDIKRRRCMYEKPAGTRIYWPPEMLLNYVQLIQECSPWKHTIPIPLTVDIWAFGLILFEAYVGRLPTQYCTIPYHHFKEVVILEAAKDLKTNGLSYQDTYQIREVPYLADILNYIFSNDGGRFMDDVVKHRFFADMWRF